MDKISPISWTPIVLFAFLGFTFLDKALRKGARRSWGWGRTIEAAPISRSGYTLIAITFFDIAAMLLWSPGRPPIFLLVLFGICLLALGMVGTRDTVKHRRRAVPREDMQGSDLERKTNISLSTMRCLGDDDQDRE